MISAYVFAGLTNDTMPARCTAKVAICKHPPMRHGEAVEPLKPLRHFGTANWPAFIRSIPARVRGALDET